MAARPSARPPRPSSTTAASTSSTTTRTQSFIAAFDAKTGREIWRTSREETQSWATPFVWENELRTEIVTAGTNRVRSYDLDGKLLWELQGHDDPGDAVAVRRARPRVHQLRLSRRRRPAGLRDPSWRVRRHLAQGRRDEQPVHRLVSAAARHLQHVGGRLRRLLLHAARSRIPAVPRREDRASRSTGASASQPSRAASPRRRGPTTARSSC